MAKFEVDMNLLEKAAALVIDPVNEIADDVHDEAKRLAPSVKVWDTMGDDRVRDPWHVDMEGQRRPDNLRFDLESHPWDRFDPEGPGLGPRTYMRFPKDESSKAVVNIISCRCSLSADNDGIKKLITVEKATKLQVDQVIAKVVCEGDWVVQAERGTVYSTAGLGNDGDLVARGEFFMRTAAWTIRNKRNRLPGTRARR